MNRYDKSGARKWRFHIQYVVMLLTSASLFGACEKKDSDLSDIPDQNVIGLLVADNFNLKFMDAMITRGGFRNTLQDPGPFTLLAPSDQAFNDAGYEGTGGIAAMPASDVAGLMGYHTLEGRYEFNTLPFSFNQEIEALNGRKMYVTHWVKGQDTILAINGARVVSQNIPAANGLVQVIDRLLEPYTHDRLLDALASERDLTLFYQALIRSGLGQTLAGTDLHSVFAPTNAAMVQFGLQTLKQINEQDPAEMAELVKRHIITERRFIYDYILTTGSSNVSSQTMSDGNNMTVKLVPNPNIPGSFNSITLRGVGNASEINITRRDILTGNGVLHVIDGVLRANQ